MDKYTIAPPAGSTQNSVGAEDRPWAEGHFNSVKLNGGDLGTYLAESTGYGIVSGCEPSISGLTVTVASGVVHLADGTRKEISATNITLNAADSTNPRIDLVYITSTGEVAKITGTASASPSAPALPTGGISVCNVTIAAGASTGTIADKRKITWQAEDKVEFLFPATISSTARGDCEIIKTPDKVMMIDSSYSGHYSYLIQYLKAHNITKIDYFLLTHYHGDHYGNINNFLNQTEIDFSECTWFIPVGQEIAGEDYSQVTTVQNWLNVAGANVVIMDSDRSITLSESCTVDFWCCGDDFRSWMSTQTNTFAPYNAYSIYALVKHKDIKVLYTGDGWYPETKYIYDNYDVEAVDLLKITHHNDGYTFGEEDVFLYKKLSPKYAVYNQNVSNVNEESNWCWLNSMLPGVTGTEIYSLSLGDKEFISDGAFLQDKSNNKLALTAESGSFAYHVYVDINVSADIVGDGSASKPYKYINTALSNLPKNIGDYADVHLHIADGTYKSLRLVNANAGYYMHGDNVTIEKIFIIASTKPIEFQITNLQSNVVDVTRSASVVFYYLTINMLANDYIGLNIRMSRVQVYINFTLNGRGKNDNIEANVVVYNGTFVTAQTTINNVGGVAIATAEGARICINSFGGDNFNCAFGTRGGSEISEITVGQYRNLGSNYVKKYDNSKRYQIKLPEHRYCWGTTIQRPNCPYINQVYFDDTLKKLIIWNGTFWIDTTNGNRVS